MELLRAALKGSVQVKNQASLQKFVRHAPFGYQPSHHFSILSSVDWDHRSSQFTCQSPSPDDSSKLGRYLQPCSQTVRFRRHDRASAFTKPRPKTKKQRQAYNRRMKKIQDMADRHSAPGSKAGPRRQWIKERKQQLLDSGSEREVLDLDAEHEYGYEDALIEDIMGNTSHLTSQPTPEPVYLGGMYPKYYSKVAGQMETYRQSIDAQAKETKEHELLDVSAVPTLPSDKAISDLLRSYRDANGTRNRPIGIVAALQHLLADVGVPTAAFGEKSYTSLLTCCRTPKEARRIFKLMRDHRHPISAYSWSILVDIHAKLGDYEGCAQVIEEMASEGIAPTQAAYTSLLAACYKVCNDGRIPHSIRAKAGKVGWSHWQQMRIVGIEADAMAFGAVIRLCAARGQPERAINLLEEMHRFDVKPTTLCFSSALRAVARSHEIGTRFERGNSKKQLRRETFTAHHGKMAREIAIMAENAEVELDDGFVSALMLCAAAAGDSATAKAVFLAAEVRKMDHLRTIGGESHLKQLRGTLNETSPHEPVNSLHGLQRGDSGDGLSAITTVDGQLAVGGQSEIVSFGQREYGKDTRSISALLHSCAKAINNNGIGTMWAGKENQGYLCENSLRLITTRWEPSYSNNSIQTESSTKLGISQLRRYDEHNREEKPKKGVRKKFRGLYVDDDDAVFTNEDIDDFGTDTDVLESLETESKQSLGGSSGIENEEIIEQLNIEGRKDETLENLEVSSVEEVADTSLLDESDMFEAFFTELKEEAATNGEEFDLDKGDALELFGMMQNEFAEALDTDNIENMDLSELEKELFDASGVDDIDGKLDDSAKAAELFERGDLLDTKQILADLKDDNEAIAHSLPSPDISEPASQNDIDLAALGYGSDEEHGKLQDLQEALPGMPVSRLRKVLKCFNSTLGYPSMMTLVPILRETMPDRITTGWLKKVNTKSAEFAFQKAEGEGSVNVGLLNSMLQVKTSSGSLDGALEFHSNQYRKHMVKPTGYSDRLVLQMLVENNRMTRALTLKQKIEEDRRTIDIPSYGSIIEYYSRHGQLGSALLFLKECIRQHGAAPSEKYLARLRVVARQQNLEKDLMITEMIGEDPIKWLKHGERFLKREMSKKGRRNVKIAYNRALA